MLQILKPLISSCKFVCPLATHICIKIRAGQKERNKT